MARSFTATSHVIGFGTAGFPQAAGSVSVWWYPTFAQSDGIFHVLFDVRPNGSNIFHVTKSSTNALVGGWFTAGAEYRVTVAAGAYTLNQNDWNHLALTWNDSSNITRLWLNGSNVGSNTSTLATFDSTGTTRYIGNFSGASLDARGRLAEFAVFDRALTADEVGALVGRCATLDLRPIDYLPLFGVSSPEPNYCGGTAGTVTGATAADHAPARLSFARRGRLFLPGAAGGATATPVFLHHYQQQGAA